MNAVRQAYLKGFMAKLAQVETYGDTNKRWAPLLAALGLGQAGVTGYLYGVAKPLGLRSGTPLSVHKSLLRYLQNHGIAYGRSPAYGDALDATLAGNSLKARILHTQANIQYAYDPEMRKVYLGRGRMPQPGVLAHELGHTTQKIFAKPLGNFLYAAGRHTPILGLLGATLSGDESKARTSAALGSLGALPMLGYEANASWRGSQLLKGLKGLKGVSRLGRVGSFIGLPTYAILAALPWLGYGMKKHMHGYTQA